MCLTKEGCRRKATKDIECYKVLLEYNDNGVTRLFSPYYGYKEWEIGKTFINYERGYSPTPNSHNVFGGYYHSYENLQYSYLTSKDIERRQKTTKPRVVICKAIIPKGTYYYYGYHYGGYWGYASKELKIVEVL
jgi:hypothetical protein